MTFDPYAPYGPLVESVVRVVTWNVWGRYGPIWETRQVALEDTLAEVAPDVICLVEAWRYGESSQPGRVASRLGLPYQHFVGAWEQEDWVSGIGLVCRWPMSEPQRLQLRSEDGAGSGEAVHGVVDGERGAIHLFAVMLDYPLGASAIRQGQVKQLGSFIRQVTSTPLIRTLSQDDGDAPAPSHVKVRPAAPSRVSPRPRRWPRHAVRARSA